MRPLLLSLMLACRRDDPHEPPVTVASGAQLGNHPEVATVIVASWEQHVSGEGWLSWTVEGVESRSPVQSYAPGPASQMLFGVPASTPVEEIVLHLSSGDQEQTVVLGEMSTGPLPEDLFEGTLTAIDEALMRPEPYLLTSVDVGLIPFRGPCYTVIVNRQGRIVWYRATPGSYLTWQARVSRSGGALVIDESTLYTFGVPDPPGVTRLTLGLGRQETVMLPGMAIAYDELPDGSWLYDERGSPFLYHLTRLWPDGTTQRLWSCDPWMEEYERRPDNCATNTVLWNESRGTVLWSSYKTGTVVEISLETGELVREFGTYPGGYTFEPPESAFEDQHYPNWTADGTLILSAHDPATEHQVAYEYEVDDATGALRQIWSTTTEIYANYAGQIQVLPSDHLLWQLGTAGVVQEITRDGVVLWSLQWPDSLVGNATPIADLYALDAGW